MQSRPSIDCEPEGVPAPGRPVPLSAALGWNCARWQSWHSQGVRLTSRARCEAPCGRWQVRQSSAAGGCSHRKGPRYSAWQDVQVSLTVPVRSMAGPGPPCGAFPGRRYPTRRAAFAPGDLLVLYTDGVTEAFGPEGEQFGEPRLEAILGETAALPPSAMARALLQAIHAFESGHDQTDDITLLVLDGKAG